MYSKFNTAPAEPNPDFCTPQKRPGMRSTTTRIKLFDCQTNFDFPDFDDDRDHEWQRAKDRGVKKLVISGAFAKIDSES